MKMYVCVSMDRTRSEEPCQGDICHMSNHLVALSNIICTCTDNGRNKQCYRMRPPIVAAMWWWFCEVWQQIILLVLRYDGLLLFCASGTKRCSATQDVALHHPLRPWSA